MQPANEGPARLTSVPIERVRVPLERRSLESATRRAPLTLLRAWALREFGVTGDEAFLRAIRARLVRLREATSPRVFVVVNCARYVLRVHAPIELYLMPAERFPPELDNASVAWHGDTILILLTRAAARAADPATLLAIIGHELGHALAHRPRFRPDAFSWKPRGFSYDPEDALLAAMASVRSQAAELTADRFALLAGQDLDAFLRLFFVAATRHDAGLGARDPESYLAACIDAVERDQRAGARLRGRTHPLDVLRTYASWRFSRSDLYRELTGRGPGTDPIDAVNDALAALVDTSVEVNLAALGDPIEPARILRETRDATTAAFGDLGASLRDAARSLAEADPLGAIRAAAAELTASHESNPAPAEPAPTDPETREVDPETAALLARFDELERRAKPSR